jgi:hypothetical protein
MTTSPTDTPKRDEADLDAFETWFASLTRMERDQRFSASYFMREAWNAALRLPAPPSQGKVERAREIKRRLIESSGQGTDGAEAMRRDEVIEECASVMDAMQATWLERHTAELVRGQPLNSAIEYECGRAARRIRALKFKQPSDTGAGK